MTIDFRAHCVIVTQRTWPPSPCYLRHFPIFDKIDSFGKDFLNVLRIKRANCIFEELSNLYLIVLLISFFPLFCGLQQKIGPLIWTTKSGGTQNNKHINCTLLIINNCINVGAIMDWKLFLHYFWLQEFIQQQT